MRSENGGPRRWLRRRIQTRGRTLLWPACGSATAEEHGQSGADQQAATQSRLRSLRPAQAAPREGEEQTADHKGLDDDEGAVPEGDELQHVAE